MLSLLLGEDPRRASFLINSKEEMRKSVTKKKTNHSTCSKLMFSRADGKWMNVVISFTSVTYLGFSCVIKILTLLRAFLAPVAAASLL